MIYVPDYLSEFIKAGISRNPDISEKLVLNMIEL